MNRSEKRRQQKMAKKAAKSTKPAQIAHSSPAQQTLNIQQAINLAVQHHNAGSLTKAESIYQQILQVEPKHPVTLHLLGMIAHQVGKNEIAVDLISKAIVIKPDFAEAHSNLGLVLQTLGKLDEALASYNKALAIKPDDANEYYNLGNVLQSLVKLDEAAASYNKALTINPDFAEAHSNLASVLQSLGKLVEAAASYKKAIAINPGFAEMHSNLGNVLQRLMKFDEAAASYKKAIAINPDFAVAHTNLGNILHGLGQLDEAVVSHNKALAINPNYAEAHSNLGLVLQSLGKLDEAVASYKKAVAINPDYADAHFNLGLALLNNGSSKEGLEKLEWRGRMVNPFTKVRHFSQPLWDGYADIKDQSILLWGEQGPQDISIWSSCLPYIKSLAGHCIVECPSKLVPLLSRSFPDVEIRPEDLTSDKERHDFDYHLPMGSLFRHFLDFAEAPQGNPFLIPDPDRVEIWRRRLREFGTGPFIGISWKSPRMTPQRSPNYTKIADWKPVFANQEATFINLQSKDFEDDISMAKRDFGVTIHNFEDLDHYDDLDEVAALAGALSGVISVSTAVAAITAGIGTPTWVLTWRQSDWNNFFYAPRGPSVRIFQRNTWEPWDAVFKSIAKDLPLLRRLE